MTRSCRRHWVLFFCESLIFSTYPSRSEGTNANQGQQVACNNHRDIMGVYSQSSTTIPKLRVCGGTYEHLAVRWIPYWCAFVLKYYHLRRGCVGTHKHLAVRWNPLRFSPQGVACGAEGRMANFRTTTSGAALTSPPEEVFRSILRKEYILAVGTHYWQTRIHQAGFSPRHRRDDRAGTTIFN